MNLKISFILLAIVLAALPLASRVPQAASMRVKSSVVFVMVVPLLVRYPVQPLNEVEGVRW